MSMQAVNLEFAVGVLLPTQKTSKVQYWSSKHLGWGGKLGRVSCYGAKRDKKVQAVFGKKTNLYEVLSLVSVKVGMDEIKKAYRSMALRYHPDVCSNSCCSKDESTRRFVEVQKAYETLSDPVSRRMHDYELGLISNHSNASMGCSLYSEYWDKEIRRSNFPNQVWETQLCGLRERSKVRMERKR